MPLSRRELLTLGVIAGGVWLLSQLPEDSRGNGEPAAWAANVSEATATPEAPKALAWGQFFDKSGNVIGERLPVLGVNGFNFVIGLAGGGSMEVAMSQLRIVEGYPWKEVVSDKRLGVRLDKWQFAGRARLVGAENVRVAGATEELGEDSDFERMLAEADKEGLGVLVVFNPTFPRDDSYYIQKLEVLLRNHPRVKIQLGNEPDNTAPESVFWRGDWDSFGHFVRIAIDTIRRINPSAEVVLAATVMPEDNETTMLSALATVGVDLRDPNLIFSVHAYHTTDTVRQKVEATKAALSQYGVANPRIIISEMGVYTAEPTADNLLEMTRKAYELGVEEIYYHELLNWQGFGLAAWDWSYLSPLFWEVAAAVRMDWQW